MLVSANVLQTLCHYDSYAALNLLVSGAMITSGQVRRNADLDKVCQVTYPNLRSALRGARSMVEWKC